MARYPPNRIPSHTYTTSGFFDVSLTVSNVIGSDISTQVSYITVDLLPPVADFSGTPTEGLSPLVVSFSDLSRWRRPGDLAVGLRRRDDLEPPEPRPHLHELGFPHGQPDRR